MRFEENSHEKNGVSYVLIDNQKTKGEKPEANKNLTFETTTIKNKIIMMNEKQREQFNLVMNVGRLISMITLTIFAVFGMKLMGALLGTLVVFVSWIPKRKFREWFTNGFGPKYKEEGAKVIGNLKTIALTLLCVYAVGGVYVVNQAGILVIVAIVFMAVPRSLSEWIMDQDD